MNIELVTLNKEDVDFIFNQLTEQFQPYKAKHNPDGHNVNFPLVDRITVWANLHLTVDEKKYNQEDKTVITTYIVDLSTCLFYNGVSVEGLEHTNI